MALAKDINPEDVIEWEMLGRKYRMDPGLAETIEDLLAEILDRYEEEGTDDLGMTFDGCIVCVQRALIMATASQIILGIENGLVE